MLHVRLTELRERTKLSLQEIADRTGVPIWTLYSLSRGYRGAGGKTVAAFVRAFPELSWDELFTLDGVASTNHRADSASR